MEASLNQVYTSIDKLPFSKFLECYCEGDLSVLIISGTPSEEELIAVWEDILQQYNDAIGGTRHSANINLYRELYRLQIKLQQINIAISVLNRYYVKEFAVALNKLLHSSFRFDVTRREEYDEELQKCETRSKGISLQISRQASRLRAINQEASNEQSVKPERSYFQKLLINLSDHAGRELDENTMTVFVFCERLKRYIKYVEHSKKTIK